MFKAELDSKTIHLKVPAVKMVNLENVKYQHLELCTVSPYKMVVMSPLSCEVIPRRF